MTEKEVTCGNISALLEASGLGFLLPDEYQWVILFFLHFPSLFTIKQLTG